MARLAACLHVALLCAAMAAPAHGEQAQVAVGLGAHTTRANTEVNLRFIDARRVWALQPVYGLSFGTRGTGFAGAGLAYTWRKTDGSMFVRGSILAGVYHKGRGPDLGGRVTFRSGVELGFALDRDTDIGIGFDHRSNAGLHSNNPGLNSAHLFISRAVY